jgi:DNA-binding NarL/FixJ family response regulator
MQLSLNPMNTPVSAKSVFIVDDHDIVRYGLETLLNARAALEVVGTAVSLQSAQAALEKIKPDLLITDMSLPDSQGLDTVRAMVLAQAPRPVLVLSMHDELIYAERVLSMGAQGYLMKEKAHEMVVQAAQTLLAGERWVSPKVSAQLLNRIATSRTHRRSESARTAWLSLMSLREVQVLERVGRGQTTKEIAYALDLSPRTVDVHRANIKKKLGLRSGAEVVAFAISRL